MENLRKLQSRNVFVREFEKIVDLEILEAVDSGLASREKRPDSCMNRSRFLTRL